MRVNQASDAPQSIQDIFVTRAALGQDNQTIQNLTTIQGQVQTADSASRAPFSCSIRPSHSAPKAPAIPPPAARSRLWPRRCKGIESQLVAISNTEVGGVYVFSGDASASPPYQVDTSSPTGVDRLITPQQSTLAGCGSHRASRSKSP